MCIVKGLDETERRVNIITKDGRQFESEWYLDKDEEKVADMVNRTEVETNIYNAMLKEHGLTDDDVYEWFIQRKRNNGEVYISDHAFDRMKERCGLSRKASVRLVKKVYDKGTDITQVKGYMAPWARQRQGRAIKGERSLLYGDFVYIFAYETLITVIHKPQKGKVSFALN